MMNKNGRTVYAPSKSSNSAAGYFFRSINKGYFVILRRTQESFQAKPACNQKNYGSHDPDILVGRDVTLLFLLGFFCFLVLFLFFLFHNLFPFERLYE